MVAALNMPQPMVNNDVTVSSSHAEANDMRPEQSSKTSFKRVFDKLAGNNDRSDSKSVHDIKNADSNSGKTSVADETNTANSKATAVKLLREMKQALMEKTEGKRERTDETGAVNPAIPESMMGMLQRLEQSVTAATAEKSETGDKQLALLINELKSVINKGQEAQGSDETGNQLTALVAARVNRSIAMPENADGAGDQQSAPVTAEGSRATALLEQIEKMLADDPEQKNAQIDASVKSGAIPVRSDKQSTATTWIEYLLQRQQEETTGQKPAIGQNEGESGIKAQEPETRKVITQLMTASTHAQGVSEQPSQQQPVTTSGKSAESAIGGDASPSGVKGGNSEGFSCRSASPATGHNSVNPVNVSKTDNLLKSAESQDVSKVEIIYREVASKEKSEFTDGGTQQNSGEKGGNSSTNSILATSAHGFELTAQNTTQPQVPSQSENVKTPVQEHIMNQVKEKLAHYEPAAQGGNITMKLHPEELGELKINMRMDAMRVKVEIVAQNQVVKDTIMQNVDNLRDMLSSRNITIDRFDVSTGGGQGSNQAFREGRQMAGDMSYKSYDDTPAMLEDVVGQKNGFWEPAENSLVNLRL
jgi:flagellar hook-length control protein FliK